MTVVPASEAWCYRHRRPMLRCHQLGSTHVIPNLSDALKDHVCDACQCEGFRTRWSAGHDAWFCDGCWEANVTPAREHSVLPDSMTT